MFLNLSFNYKSNLDIVCPVQSGRVGKWVSIAKHCFQTLLPVFEYNYCVKKRDPEWAKDGPKMLSRCISYCVLFLYYAFCPPRKVTEKVK